jgi:hypothetical protein
MSIETVVVFSRARQVSPEAWQARITTLGWNLQLDTEFDPLQFSGFLPCRLEGQACGFEYWLDPLEEESRDELGPHCAPEWDAVLTLVSRSELADCQAAVMAAAAFALCVDGGVLGDEDELLPRAATLEWAQRLIVALEAAEDEQREAEKRREVALAAGADGALLQSLAALAGRSGSLLSQMGLLAFVAKPDLRVSSSAWVAEIDGRRFDSSRYAALRDEQMALLSAGGPAHRLDQLDRGLDKAGAQDEADAHALAKLLPSLGDLTVTSARHEAPGTIAFELSGTRPVSVRWFGMGTSSLSLSAAGLRWTFDKAGAALL